MAGWSRSGGPRQKTSSECRPDDSGALEEIAELAASTGAEVVGSIQQRSPRPDPATLIGAGKTLELRSAAQAAGAFTILFNQDLSPTQLRNLEHMLGLKVIDRTQLILDIFARRARSREGKLQVELAQLSYLLPRLAGRGAELSRLGGGIGTRGPGEQQLEFDRRRIRARIQHLQQALERVRSQRALHRSHRQEHNFLMVALVGYTNAGKSTLFNRLTGAQTVESHRMFATLDPTVRLLPLELPRPVLLSDTVGFIRELPRHLVTAFRATLEELKSANLLLHIIDASHPRRDQQRAAVEAQLDALGVVETPRLTIWNKIDLMDPTELQGCSNLWDVAVSARTGSGIESLLSGIGRELTAKDPLVEAEFRLSAADGEALAILYRLGKVMGVRMGEGELVVKARLSASHRDLFFATYPSQASKLRQVVEI
jgi:GTP-binding protein HflX